MIRNNELRLGNYILAPTGANNFYEWDKIIEIGLLRVVVHNNGVMRGAPLSYDVLRPILLTEEVLEQCSIQPGYLHEGDGGYFITGIENQIPVIALHELQNLYFGLTGLECILQTC